MFGILISVIFGNLLISSYQDETVMKSEGNVYILQYGIYTTKEVLNENIYDKRKIDDSFYKVFEDISLDTGVKCSYQKRK